MSSGVEVGPSLFADAYRQNSHRTRCLGGVRDITLTDLLADLIA
jgi:hypothetical protein